MISEKRQSELSILALQDAQIMRKLEGKPYDKNLGHFFLHKISPPCSDEEADFRGAKFEAIRELYGIVSEWAGTLSRKDLEDKLIDLARKWQTGQNNGASSTHDKATQRHERIRQVYSAIKADSDPEVPRWWLREQTVKHFQGKRKNPRRYYGETTVKNITKGL